MSLGHDKIPIFLAVDVEPDQNLDVGRRGPVSWTGARDMRLHLEDLRESLAEATGSPLRVGWYIRMDPHIEAVCGAVDRGADHISDIAVSEDGDYLGLHVHAIVWDPHRDCWVRIVHDFGRQLEHLKVGLEAFATRMGEPPLRHRFTDGLVRDPAFYAVLAKAGVKVDLSPERGLGSRFRLGTRQIACEPPLTLVRRSSTSRSFHEEPRWRTVARRLRHPLARWSLSPHMWANLSPTEYWDEMTRSLANMRRPYVSIAFRTNPADSRSAERRRAVLDALVTHRLARSLRFADPLELVPTTSATETSFAITFSSLATYQ